jgi:hypothetical protein
VTDSKSATASDQPLPGDGSPGGDGSGRRRWLTLAAQVAGSLLVLGLLVHDAEPARITAALSRLSVPLLLAAMGIKALGLMVRELRLWVALAPWGRPALPTVLGIGLASGLLNVVLPARAGDLTGAALLNRECGLRSTAAVAAVGITSVVEALVFGVVLLLSMALAFDHWLALLGGAAQMTVGWLSLLTVVTVGSMTGLVLLAKRLGAGEPRRGPGPMAWIQAALQDTGEGLGALGPLVGNVGLASVQVAAVIGGNLLLFPALGLPMDSPYLAALLVVAVGSFLAVTLPPSLGAGNAATSVGVLALFGVGGAEALAYAGLLWVVHCITPLLLGVWPLWKRLGRLPDLLRGTP